MTQNKISTNKIGKLVRKHYLQDNPRKFKTFGNIPNPKYQDKTVKHKLIDRELKILRKLGFEHGKREIQYGKQSVYIDKIYKRLSVNWSTTNYKGIKLNNGAIIIPNLRQSLEAHIFRKYNKPKITKKGILDITDKDSAYATYLINGTLALNQAQNTNTIYIDIDVENGFEIYKEIKKKFKIKYELMIEQSILGRIHVIIKTNKSYSDLELSKFEDELKKINDHIDVRNRNTVFRYPNSHSYKTGYIKNNEFIEYLTYEEYQKSTLSKNHKLSLKISKYLPKIQNIKIIDTKTKKDRVVNPLFGPRIYNNVNKDNKNLKEKLMNNYPITEGHRLEQMKKIASLCVYLGYKADKFYEACMSNNKSSKDFKRWSSKKSRQECIKYYDGFSFKFKRNTIQFQNYEKYEKNNEFISNIDNLPFSLLIMINKLSNIIFNKLSKDIISENWKNITRLELRIFLKELIGYIIFDNNNPKTQSKKSKLSQNIAKLIIEGFQVPRIFIDKMKIYHNMKINLRKLSNAIMSIKELFELQYINKLSYSYNTESPYSRTYKLNSKDISIKSIIELINKYIEYGITQYNMCELNKSNKLNLKLDVVKLTIMNMTPIIPILNSS